MHDIIGYTHFPSCKAELSFLHFKTGKIIHFLYFPENILENIPNIKETQVTTSGRSAQFSLVIPPPFYIEFIVTDKTIKELDFLIEEQQKDIVPLGKLIFQLDNRKVFFIAVAFEKINYFNGHITFIGHEQGYE